MGFVMDWINEGFYGACVNAYYDNLAKDICKRNGLLYTPVEKLSINEEEDTEIEQTYSEGEEISPVEDSNIELKEGYNGEQEEDGKETIIVNPYSENGQEDKKELSNDMGIVKFEMLIKDITKFGSESVFDNGYHISNKEYLALIYDYDKLNAYGKAIIQQGRGEENVDDYWLRDNFTSLEDKISNTMVFIKKCNNDSNKSISLYFIFWAMMILAVDDTDKEKHLSLICDFARMLKISDEEMMDIVQVIQMICNKAEDVIEFQTGLVPYHFYSLLSDIGYVSGASVSTVIMGLALAPVTKILEQAGIEGEMNVNEIGKEIKRWEKKTP